jgi:hypothetical protein
MPTPSSRAFPSDPFQANGSTVSGAEKYSAAPRHLTIWGGTITAIEGPTHSGSVNGNSTADFLVHFESTGKAVLLAWGGHLAQSAYWDTASGGPRDGAAMVSGAPWHMRTLQIDGAGNKNQDRSIQPSAIVGELPPLALAPATPRPTARPTPRAPGATAPPADGGGGGTGTPNTPAAAASNFPLLTPPATSTDRVVAARTSGVGLGLAAAVAMLISVLSVAVVRSRFARRREG